MFDDIIGLFMSENDLTPAFAPVPPERRRPIGWAIALGVLLLALGGFVAFVGVMTGLLVFNGCYGPSNPVEDALSMGWILGVWPLAVLATALVPPILLGAGRRAWVVLAAFAAGCLVSLLVWLAWLGLGYLWMC